MGIVATVPIQNDRRKEDTRSERVTSTPASPRQPDGVRRIADGDEAEQHGHARKFDVGSK